MPLTPHTVPVILTRSRDVDPVVRKLLFSTILFMGAHSGKPRSRKYQSSSKFEHPRQLTLAQREKVVSDGLGDREDAVRAAAARTVAAWYDIVSSGDDSLGDLVAFVKLFDAVSPEDIDVAADALKSLFLTRNVVIALDGNVLHLSHRNTCSLSHSDVLGSGHAGVDVHRARFHGVLPRARVGGAS